MAAVHDFTLAAERGEFVSFLGPSGCGKTTTLRMIAGFERPTAGTIVINGVDMTDRPRQPAERRDGLPVVRPVPEHDHRPERRATGSRSARWPRPEIKRRVEELLELIHLPEKGDRYPYQLSGGQQQRVALARALAIEPQVLLLDEPLSALDAKIRIILRKEIRAIQRQLGITTVYVTHDQEEALSLSDRVVVMSEGRIEQIGTPFEIYNFPATAFVASFVGTLNLVAAGVIDAGPGRLSLEGQEIRTTKAVTEAGRRWTGHAGRPARGHLAGRRPRGREPAARHDRRHQLPRLDRPPAAPARRRRGGPARRARRSPSTRSTSRT